MKAQVSHFSHASEFAGVDDCVYEETEGRFQEFVAEMEHSNEHISVHTIFQVASNFVDWLSERCIFMEDLVKNKAISRLGFQSLQDVGYEDTEISTHAGNGATALRSHERGTKRSPDD